MPLEAIAAAVRAHHRSASSHKLTRVGYLRHYQFNSALNCRDGLVHNVVKFEGALRAYTEPTIRILNAPNAECESFITGLSQVETSDVQSCIRRALGCKPRAFGVGGNGMADKKAEAGQDNEAPVGDNDPAWPGT